MSGIIMRPSDLMREQWLEKLHKSEILHNFKPRFDYVLVDPDPCRNFYRMYGPDGNAIDIEVETSYSKEYNSTSGRLVALPSRVSDSKDWNKDLLEDVELGDRLYFHFNCIEGAQSAGYGIEDETGYLYLMIHVSMIYCYVRHPGEIEMLSDHILVQPILEDEEKIKTSSGLFIKPRAENIAQMAIVTHYGTDNGKPSQIFAGDKILFEADCEYQIVIEGNTYYKQRHNEVMAIVK